MKTKQNTNQKTNSRIPYHKQPKYQPLYQLFKSIHELNSFDDKIKELFGSPERDSFLSLRVEELFNSFLYFSELQFSDNIDEIWSTLFENLDVRDKFEKIMSYLESDEV